MENILSEELLELKHCVEKQIPYSKLEACVRAMVRINIEKTKYKQIVACFQFRDDYPKSLTLLELRSRHVSDKLLDGLSKLCDEEMKKYLGKPQVMRAMKFISSFMEDHPLCCCSEEILNVKKLLRSGSDEIKLKQKTSSLSLRVRDGEYYIVFNIGIPEDYPDKQVDVSQKDSNFPQLFQRWFEAQSLEIARRCVTPPIKKKPKDPPFIIKPSLGPVASFLIEEVHKYPNLSCAICNKNCFPSNSKDIEMDENKPDHIERVYCGHIYHQQCLDSYIRSPPFHGQKKCHTCNNLIFHEKWKLTTGVVEARWAHKQAKQRELDEVVDFLS